MFDNEPYESDNEYLDESDDDTQYKDIDYRRNDQSKASSDLSELLETESQNLKCFVKTNKILKLNHC